MKKREIRDAVKQLVEAWHDQQGAPQQLNTYKANNPAPKPPDQFESLDKLLKFDKLRRSYQTGLKNHENQIVIARNSYMEAADMLRTVLPENTSLQYIYEGDREDLRGGRYLIVNTKSGINIRWHTQPESSPY